MMFMVVAAAAYFPNRSGAVSTLEGERQLSAGGKSSLTACNQSLDNSFLNGFSSESLQQGCILYARSMLCYISEIEIIERICRAKRSHHSNGRSERKATSEHDQLGSTLLPEIAADQIAALQSPSRNQRATDPRAQICAHGFHKALSHLL